MTHTHYAQRMVIGGVAGTVAKTAVAPFERVRIMAQTGHGAGSAWGTGKLILQREGFTGLWRGNFVNCARVFPSRGILFGCNDAFKAIMAKAVYTEIPTNKVGKPAYPFWLSFSAGALAGMTACVVTYPMDVARTRMSGKIVKTGASETRLISTLSNMVREEGFSAWYRGVGPTLLGSLPYEGIKFAVYDWVVDVQSNHFGIDPAKSVSSKLFSGAVAGAAAGISMFPNDTVRRLLQMQGAHGSKVLYSSAWDCWKTLYREEGVVRFFRGIGPYLIRMVPNSAIQFGMYGYLADKLL
mmetsp:Transcript_25093/g.70894  ORF Transcript_25093/g.70894 Transcript_25093/m.70894 type:complete len:297 (+) Transcript_25093:281-1171(+)